MANMMDYLAWRGDITLLERPFNEVDNLILAELAYAELADIVPGMDSDETVPLARAAERYRELGYTSPLVNDPGALFAAAGESPRFASVNLGGYVNRIDPARQIQFSAVTFYLPDGTQYVAFRGTDNSIVGWREDFNFSFTQTPGQEDAVAYLNRAAEHPGRIRVGGHSKGGNLAVYAAAFCEPEVRERIDEVYSNDGPGFNRSVASSAQMKSVEERVRLIVPETSLVGILLNNKQERSVVKSSASGVLQHNPLTWQIRGAAFERLESQSNASLFMDEALSRWLDGLDDVQRRTLVDAIFDTMDASGAQTLTELGKNGWDSWGAILKAVVEIDPDVRRDVLETLGKLATAGRDVLWADMKENLEQRFNLVAARLKPPQEDK